MESVEGQRIVWPATPSETSILLVPGAIGIHLTGAFSFQVLYGRIEVHGHIFAAKKFEEQNYQHVANPVSLPPLHFKLVEDTPTQAEENGEDAKAIVMSRLREFSADPSEIADAVANSPSGILLLKHLMETHIRFAAQQASIMSQVRALFRVNINHYRYTQLDPTCWLITGQRLGSNEAGISPLYPPTVVSKIEHTMKEVEAGGSLVVLGRKGTGKSTLLRHMINSARSRHGHQFSKMFLLDVDLGQPECSPPGCISLHEIRAPLLGAPFSSQESSFQHSLFFGSISPEHDIGRYNEAVKMLLAKYQELCQSSSTDEKPTLLFINACGWVEGLGEELTTALISLLRPTVLVNLLSNEGENYEIPEQVLEDQPEMRIVEMPSPTEGESCLPTVRLPAHLLRSLRIASYFGECFRPSFPDPTAQLRLSKSPLCYKVGFRSISIYLPPNLPQIADRFLLASLNCLVVGLCAIDPSTDKALVSPPSPGADFLPRRLNVEHKHGALTMRCYGFGFIRAIDPESGHFHVITPVDRKLLPEVKVFAVGHDLQICPLLFDPKENGPYVVSLVDSLQVHHTKMFESHVRVKSTMRAGQRATTRIVHGKIAKAKETTRRASLLRVPNAKCVHAAYRGH